MIFAYPGVSETAPDDASRLYAGAVKPSSKFIADLGRRMSAGGISISPSTVSLSAPRVHAICLLYQN